MQNKFHCQLSTVNCQLSTVNCQLSTVNCAQSWHMCQPSTVWNKLIERKPWGHFVVMACCCYRLIVTFPKCGILFWWFPMLWWRFVLMAFCCDVILSWLQCVMMAYWRVSYWCVLYCCVSILHRPINSAFRLHQHWKENCFPKHLKSCGSGIRKLIFFHSALHNF